MHHIMEVHVHRPAPQVPVVFAMVFFALLLAPVLVFGTWGGRVVTLVIGGVVLGALWALLRRRVVCTREADRITFVFHRWPKPTKTRTVRVDEVMGVRTRGQSRSANTVVLVDLREGGEALELYYGTNLTSHERTRRVLEGWLRSSPGS